MPTQQSDVRKNYIGIVHDRVAEQRAIEPLATSGHFVTEYFLALMAAVRLPRDRRSQMSSFSFDSKGFEKAFKKVASDAFDQRAREMQQTMDRLGRELKGQPLATAKSRLQREWQRTGGSITEPELTQYAEALVAGTRIEFKKQPIKW